MIPAHWPANQIEVRALAALAPAARNARTHSSEQIEQLAASIREWGWTSPVLIDETGSIIAGHGRVLAAERSGIDEVPVIVVRGWSDAQKRAYVIADNKLTENGGWDAGLLRLEVADLDQFGFDLALLGFNDNELEHVRNDSGDDSSANAIPPLPTAPPITQRGDLWRLDRHRLMCGDCRDSGDVARLTDGARVNLAFTSPPYAEQRAYDPASEFRPVAPADYVTWFAPVAANVRSHLAPDGSWFINIKPAAAGPDTELYVFDLVLAHAREWGWHFATEFCWERGGVPKQVVQRFKNEFEPVYQFTLGRWKMRADAVRHASENVPQAGDTGVGNTNWKDKQGTSGGIFGAHKRRNGTSQTMSDVQGANTAPAEYIGPGLAYPGNRLPTFTATHEATGHPAAFPVGLPRFFCNAFTDRDDIVFDPFAGSGSTLIAAADVGRVGLACEISPAYCDVIVERWQNFTGGKAVRG